MKKKYVTYNQKKSQSKKKKETEMKEMTGMLKQLQIVQICSRLRENMDVMRRGMSDIKEPNVTSRNQGKYLQ